MGSAAASLLAVTSVFFHVYLIFSGLLPNLITRPVHLALTLPWVFVFNQQDTGAKKWIGYLLCGMGLFGCFYIALFRDQLGDQYGSLEGRGQLIMSLGLILVILEMARRAIKLALPTVAVIALAYGFWVSISPVNSAMAGFPLTAFWEPLWWRRVEYGGSSQAYPSMWLRFLSYWAPLSGPGKAGMPSWPWLQN